MEKTINFADFFNGNPISRFFVILGYINSKKNTNNKSFIVCNRDETIFSLTASLSASALGAWILFGPASATWGE